MIFMAPHTANWPVDSGWDHTADRNTGFLRVYSLCVVAGDHHTWTHVGQTFSMLTATTRLRVSATLDPVRTTSWEISVATFAGYHHVALKSWLVLFRPGLARPS